MTDRLSPVQITFPREIATDYTKDFTIIVVPPTYTVTFVDHDGTVLDTQIVEHGSGAKAPPDPTREGYTFVGWDKAFDNVTSDLTVTAQWEKDLEEELNITFLLGNEKMGDFLVGDTEFKGLRPGDPMPAPPHPYVKFPYKFLGWKGNDGSFYAAPDYRYPNVLKDYPTEVTHSVIFTAQWAIINPSTVFPDMIPSEAHFDRWWGDYGIICYAGNTTQNGKYKIVFADWFFNVATSCTIGFGTPGKMQYEIVLTKNSIEMFQIQGNQRLPYQGAALKYGIFDVVENGKYFTKEKRHVYGRGLQGVEFENPFGSGAKQAWLY
jgi:uncharacterized repeat protein (TIGR02543 family)